MDFGLEYYSSVTHGKNNKNKMCPNGWNWIFCFIYFPFFYWGLYFPDLILLYSHTNHFSIYFSGSLHMIGLFWTSNTAAATKFILGEQWRFEYNLQDYIFKKPLFFQAIINSCPHRFLNFGLLWILTRYTPPELSCTKQNNYTTQ